MVLERLSIPRTAHANIMNICKPLVVKLKIRLCNCWDHSFSFWVFGPRMPQAKSPKPNMQEATTEWKDISLSFYKSEKVFSWKVFTCFYMFLQISLGFEEQYSKIDSLFLGPFLGNKHVKKYTRGISWPQRCHASTPHSIPPTPSSLNFVFCLFRVLSFCFAQPLAAHILFIELYFQVDPVLLPTSNTIMDRKARTLSDLTLRYFEIWETSPANQPMQNIQTWVVVLLDFRSFLHVSR